MKNGPQPTSDREFLIQIWQIVGRMDEKLDTTCNTVEKHEQRISLIERWKAGLQGRYALIGTLAGYLLGIITTVAAGFILSRLVQ